MKKAQEPTLNGDNIRKIIIVVCAFLALVVAGVMVFRYANQRAALKKLEEMAQQTETPQVEVVAETVEEEEPIADETVEEGPMTLEQKLQWYKDTYGIEVPEKNLDFADLQENTNADIYAWIYIPNTKIDYPVLQHPTDNLYYLNYNLDGSRGYPGCIYTEDYNSKDFSDPLTVMYGHNMKNGSMFANLHLFEDTQFFEDNPYIYIYLPEDVLVYQVFASYPHSDAHLLYGTNYSNSVEFGMYLDEVLSQRSMNCNLREGVEVTTSDRVLTLSTCIANQADKRYLVQGVLLDED
ncbi:MAG: class B sortase [Lachnospiraceae bacterium]|nr:class B sortase [Lachnospiraceae bacterium]